MKIPSWSALRVLSANRAIQSANVWAVVVPVTAKLLESVQDVVTVQVLGHQLPLHLSLPFSWKVLFIAAMAFLLANVLFAAFCPALVKEANTYRDYAEQRRSDSELLGVFQSMRTADKARYDPDGRWESWLNARIMHLLNRSPAQMQRHETESVGVAETFAVAIAFLNSRRPAARLAATGLYGVGLVSFAVVLWQNVLFVARHW